MWGAEDCSVFVWGGGGYVSVCVKGQIIVSVCEVAEVCECGGLGSVSVCVEGLRSVCVGRVRSKLNLVVEKFVSEFKPG